MDRTQVVGTPTSDSAVSSVTYHEPTGTYRTEFDWTTRPASSAVVSAVAFASGRDPLALPPLYSSVDPDALDRLFAPTRSGTRRLPASFSFEYADCEVTVNGHGTVEIARLTGPPA